MNPKPKNFVGVTPTKKKEEKERVVKTLEKKEEKFPLPGDPPVWRDRFMWR